jgi:protein O-GlcNAc transferase
MTQFIQSILASAVQFHQSGELAQAEPLYRSALAQSPNNPDALHLLGVLLSQSGRSAEALPLLKQAASLAPHSADILSNLAIALDQTGRQKEAGEVLRSALQIRPDHPDANFNLASLLVQQGQLDQALPLLQKASQLQPKNVLVLEKLADTLRQLGQAADALPILLQASALAPARAETQNFLGVTLAALGQTKAAVQAFEKSIALKPDYADPRNNLGLCLTGQGQTRQAIEQFQTAIRLRPNFPGAYTNLGNLLKECDQLDQAIEAYRHALALDPSLTQAHDNLLLTLHAHPDYDASKIFQEHKNWNRLHAAHLSQEIAPHQNDRDPSRRLRIGYVSPDFREHSVAHFLVGLLENHDPTQFEIFCYSDVHREDQMTARLRAASHHWRSLVGTGDAQAAQIIRQDQIDILIDLAGHTGDNRLLVFARKPAPVQVTYMGYPGTTGLTTIDWRLTDAQADPPGESDPYCSEKLFRLPKTFLCFTPPASAPAPARTTGPLTFGSFNYLPKLNHVVIETWSQILRATPTSRLILKSHGLSDDFSRELMQDRFAACGIDPTRLTLHGKIPSLADHLSLYNQIDIALDPFPYNGTTTTCEALWMGVPVVTLPGQTHAGRVGTSLLSTVGLQDLIAKDQTHYVQLAKDLAADQTQLATLRSELRQRVAQSPLTDARAFARDIEDAYRKMVRA